MEELRLTNPAQSGIKNYKLQFRKSPMYKVIFFGKIIQIVPNEKV